MFVVLAILLVREGSVRLQRVVSLSLLAAALFFSAVALDACATGGAGPSLAVPSTLNTDTTASAAASGGTGFLASDSGGVAFFQWNEADGSIVGSAQVATLSGIAPKEQVSSQTYSVSGQRNGDSISLTLSLMGNFVGTLSNGTLVLNMPQKDGSLAPVTFTSGTATDFNQALSGLRGTADAANQAAEQTASVQAQQIAIDQAVQKVRNDISGLNDQVKGMQADVQAVAKTVQAMKSDVDQTASDEKVVLAEAKQYPDGNNGQVFADATTVTADAQDVVADLTNVASDVSSVEDDISPPGILGPGIRDRISGLQADFAGLTQAETALPSYQHSSVSASEVNQAIASAQAAVTSAIAETNKYIDQANAYVNAAYQSAVAAARVGGNSLPATGEPIAHIS